MRIAQSQNTKAELTDKATSFIGMATYGQIMVGDQAFEFYNDKNPRDYIQIPWDEVELVIASVYFKGKWIPRFAIQTKRNGTFPFAARHAKRVLRAIRNHVDPDKLVYSLTFFQVIRRGFRRLYDRLIHRDGYLK